MKTQGALVRSRFLSIEQMDVSSKYFFSLEKKNGQKRFMHSLRSEAGVIYLVMQKYEQELVGFMRTCTRMSWNRMGYWKCSKAAFRLQFLQRFLYKSSINGWRAVTCAILHRTEGLGLDKSLFLIDPFKVNVNGMPVFYRNLFKVWSLFESQRNETTLPFIGFWRSR